MEVDSPIYPWTVEILHALAPAGFKIMILIESPLVTSEGGARRRGDATSEGGARRRGDATSEGGARGVGTTRATVINGAGRSDLMFEGDFLGLRMGAMRPLQVRDEIIRLIQMGKPLIIDREKILLTLPSDSSPPSHSEMVE